MLACKGGYIDVVETLIEAGANVNQAMKVGTGDKTQSMGFCCSRHSSQFMCTQSNCTIFILFWII